MKGYRRDPERTEMRVLQRHVPLKEAHIVEIGCGDGRLTRRIVGLAGTVVATDTNAPLLARAKQLTLASLRKKVRYRLAAAENLRLPAQHFDIAILSWSL
jgi:ubiquinone/menaquinone biosynthesis C-methylase UbiE